MIAAALPVLLVGAAVIDVYEREPLDYGAEPLPRASEVTRIVVEPKTPVSLFDLQYDSDQRFRGEWLGAAIGSNRPGDTALLHFTNGMLIPVPRDEIDRVFVAVQIERDDKLSDRFPRATWREEALGSGIDFGANKVIFAALSTPSARFADTLAGVEWVDLDAYLQQFQVSAKAKAGWRIYTTHCQQCHGIQQVGARRGPDFALPVPLHTTHSPRSLRIYLMFGATHGLQIAMPAVRGLDAADVDALWLFMRDAADVPIRPYLR